jgi:uncharacterized membrane protein YphA (DoxX/SURF4 family)
VIFLVAGISKASNASGIITVFAYDHIPTSLHPMLVWIVTCGEIVLGQALILGWAPRRTSLLAGAVLVIYTIQIAYLLMSAEAPTCNCVHLINQYKSARMSNLFALLRNMLMMTGVAGIVFFRKTDAE